MGYLGLVNELETLGGGVGLVLATAHPAKFADIVEDAVGIDAPVPPALADTAGLPERIVRIEASDAALRGVLLG